MSIPKYLGTVRNFHSKYFNKYKPVGCPRLLDKRLENTIEACSPKHLTITPRPIKYEVERPAINELTVLSVPERPNLEIQL